MSENIIKTKKKAQLVFTKKAWQKMISLVQSFSTEVGWHGLVERDGLTFLVTDILVYPQEVTGATVNSDQIEYQNWLYGDEVGDSFEKMNFHGHSHVYMSPSPSGTDIDHRNRLLGDLFKGQFYIFFIINKNLTYTFDIYDTTDMTRYSEKQADLIVEGSEEISEFLEDAQKKVKRRIYTSCSYQNPLNSLTPKQSTGASTSLGAVRSEAPSQKTLFGSGLKK